MSLIKGDKAIIIEGFDDEYGYHNFPIGTIVEFEKYTPFGSLFVGETTWGRESQFLLDQHFAPVTVEDEPTKPVEIVVNVTPIKLVEPEKEVDNDLPTKALYAVIKGDGNNYWSGECRDTAREIKAALGGKRNGVRIFAYGAEKEIR